MNWNGSIVIYHVARHWNTWMPDPSVAPSATNEGGSGKWGRLHVGLREAALESAAVAGKPRRRCAWRKRTPLHCVMTANCVPAQGHRKPSLESFQCAIQHLQLPSSDLLLIDDRQPNVDGATSAGLRAVKFESAGQLEADLKEAGLVF
jgi:beta-phosphoglucomutase-like phosphatase (HAD superfamily)